MMSDHLTEQQRLGATVFGAPFLGSHGFGLGLSIVRDPSQPSPFLGSGGGKGAVGWGGSFGGWWQADPARDMILLWLPEVLPAPPSQVGQMPRLPGFQGWVDLQRRAYEI
jgi:CubicO group peptidase (beta-lactamase class C family)